MQWRKYRKLMITGIIAGVFLLVVGILAILLKHEPGFYRRAALPAGPERKMLSTACLGRFTELIGCLKDGRGEWETKISQSQLNGYFEEDFVRLGDADALAKHGISQPRVFIEEDRLRIGFRYGTGLWSTVVSYELKIWMAPRDPNVLVVEILARQAGGLPLSTQSFLKDITEVGKKQNLDITWYRHNGNPTALIRFQADRSRKTFELRRFDIRNGMIVIGGVSLEPLDPVEGDKGA